MKPLGNIHVCIFFSTFRTCSFFHKLLSSAPSPYSSSNGRVNVPPALDPPAQKYHYDSSYQPGPEKIAEAHKAARFAVGALAFDEISTAVEHLKKSLELLTNPSAGH